MNSLAEWRQRLFILRQLCCLPDDFRDLFVLLRVALTSRPSAAAISQLCMALGRRCCSLALAFPRPHQPPIAKRVQQRRNAVVPRLQAGVGDGRFVDHLVDEAI